MTVNEYLSQQLQAWGVLTQAQLVDLSFEGVDPDEEYTTENREKVQRAMLDMLARAILAPYQKSISENGFSLSWDFGNVGRYYLWLCKRLGVTPDEDVTAALDISTITDKSDIW